ncbi:MAG: hypothetical protein JSR60_09240 [Proteobacteria bacterium]|nr:hypothetical protein [Pseudomonadota bacterium]
MTGCSAADLTYVSGPATLPSSPPATAATANYANFAAEAERADETCKSVARTRAQDARYQDIDSDARDAIYRKVFADCIAWANRGQK